MKAGGLILFCLFLQVTVIAQKIQYSRQTFRSPFADAMQLVADVDGYHHLLCFTAAGKPLLYIFNKALQVYSKQEMNLKLQENCDIQVVSFLQHYYLYLHKPGSIKHHLFQVTGGGEITDVSGRLNRTADSLWNRSTATYQFFNQGGRLFLVALTYFEAIKKAGSRIVELAPNDKAAEVQTAFFSFDRETEMLKQVTLTNGHLLVLKAGMDPEKGSTLEVVKIDLASGKSIFTAFNSGAYLYASPALHYDPVDSTLIVYSVIGEPVMSSQTSKNVFIAHLDHLLRETINPVLLKSQFRNNVAANFILYRQRQPVWLYMPNGIRLQRNGNKKTGSTTPELEESNTLIIGADRNTVAYERFDYNLPAGVRLTVLNKNFTAGRDTLVPNNGSVYQVPPRPFARFSIGNKAFLLLQENFSAKKRGLLLFSTGSNGELETNPLPVYDRYTYLLQQAQTTADNAFVLPYSYKNEIGLVKIIIKE